MKAELKPNFDANRKKLADIIPLPHPFTVYIEQTRYCNFKCFYCMHSTRDIADGEFNKLGYGIKHMEFSLYENVIKQLKEFPEGIKRIVFSGLGEPLMNPKLPEMVKLAAQTNIAERIEIVTNGVLLTPNVTNELVKAGITNINISIQGINAKQYEDICGAKVDFEKFIGNLTYLYNNKKNVKIYIKIIDAILKNKDEEQKFFELFGNISDRIYIEHLIDLQQQMETLKDVVDFSKNFYNEEIDSSRKVCAPAFYFLQVGCDLEVFSCPVPGLPKTLSIGNIKEKTLQEIWNGEKRKKLLKTMLELKKDTIPECKNCTAYNCITDPAENLDKDASRLVQLFK